MNPFLYILILVICGFKNPLLWEGCCTCVAKQNTKTLNKREAQNLALFSNISEDSSRPSLVKPVHISFFIKF